MTFGCFYVCAAISRSSLDLYPRLLSLFASDQTRFVTTWAKDLEMQDEGRKCLVGYAKLDRSFASLLIGRCIIRSELTMIPSFVINFPLEHLTKPLSGFVQLFTSLLDRTFSSPKEDHDLYRQKILSAISGQGAVFFSLIPQEWRSMFLPFFFSSS